MKILIVDDEENIRHALVFGLTKRGHGIKEAEHPIVALNLLQKEPFDLLVLDYRLSLISGLDIARIIRKNNAQIPIILLTSYSTFPETTLLKSCARLYLLSKDTPLETLIQAIENKGVKPN
jgi:DNA-binding response OmpR family regulator